MAAEAMTLTDPTLISGITNLCLKSTVQIVFWPSNDWTQPLSGVLPQVYVLYALCLTYSISGLV